MAIPSGFITTHNTDSPMRVEPPSQPREGPPRPARNAANAIERLPPPPQKQTKIQGVDMALRCREIEEVNIPSVAGSLRERRGLDVLYINVPILVNDPSQPREGPSRPSRKVAYERNTIRPLPQKQTKIRGVDMALRCREIEEVNSSI